jgi:hypothetical protein
VDEKRKLALMLAGVEPEEPNLVGLSRYGLGYQPDLGTDSEGDVTTGDMLAKMGRMQSGPGGMLRGLASAIPASGRTLDPRAEDEGLLSYWKRAADTLSIHDMAKGGLNTMANWLQGTPEIGPDTLAPLGMAGVGGLLPKAGASGVTLGDHAMAKWIAHRDRHKPGLESIQGEADVRMGRDPSGETFEDHYGKARVGEKHPLNIKPAYQPTDYDFRQTFDAQPPPPPGTTKAISATESAWGPDVPDWFKWSMAHDNARADRKAIDQYRTGLNAASLRELTEDINFFHKQMEGLPFNSPEFKAYRMRLDAAREALEGLKTRYEVVPGDLLADNSKSSLPGLVAGSLDMSQEARMARAREMGFNPDETWYHGTATDQPIDMFRSGLNGETHAQHDTPSIFFSDRPDIADQYARSTGETLREKTSQEMRAAGRSEDEIAQLWDQSRASDNNALWSKYIEQSLSGLPPDMARILRGSARAGHDLDAVSLEKEFGKEAADTYRRNTELAKSVGDFYPEKSAIYPVNARGNMLEVDANVFGGQFNEIMYDQLLARAKEQGYDGLKLRNVVDSPTGRGEPSSVMAVFDPKNIRSKYAAFDPSKSDSANLLAAKSDNPIGNIVDSMNREGLTRSPDSPSAAGARNTVLIDDIAEDAAHPSGPIQAYHGSRAVGSAGDLDPSFSGHLGVHFGTREQATKRLSQEHLGYSEEGGQVFPATIDLKNPITLPDLGSWSGDKLIKAVIAADPRAKGLEMPPKPAPGSSVKAYDEWADKAQPIVRDWLSRNGYDGIRYRNTEEGKGWSYIVLDKKSIRSSPDSPSAAGALPVQGIRAYHGSPHDFDAFDINRIGSGEGAQAYGHGLYFAENKNVGLDYQRGLSGDTIELAGVRQPKPEKGSPEDVALAALSNAQFNQSSNPFGEALRMLREFPASDKGLMERAKAVLADWEGQSAKVVPSGRMYEVNIKADPSEFLDWDKPLSQQSEGVRKAVEKFFSDLSPAERAQVKDAPGGDWVKGIGAKLRKQSAGANPFSSGQSLNDVLGSLNRPDLASNALSEAGIKGIRYLDQGSRDKQFRIHLKTGKGAPYETEPITFSNRADAERAAADYQQKGFQADIVDNGSRNYVVFSDKDVEILKKYGWVPVGMAGGGMMMAAPGDAQAAPQSPQPENGGLIERLKAMLEKMPK